MSLFKGIISGITGAIFFLIFLFVLDIGFMVSIMAGIVSFAAILLIFSSLSSKTIEIEVDVLEVQLDHRYARIQGRGRVAIPVSNPLFSSPPSS